MVAPVVEVHAIQHDSGVRVGDDRFELRVELGLAVVTAVRGVCQVLRVGEFIGPYDLVPDANLPGKLCRGGELARGQAGACPRDGHRLIA